MTTLYNLYNYNIISEKKQQKIGNFKISEHKNKNRSAKLRNDWKNIYYSNTEHIFDVSFMPFLPAFSAAATDTAAHTSPAAPPR